MSGSATVRDGHRDRTVEIHWSRPDSDGAFPLALVGHGMNGSGADAVRNARFLVSQGYVVVAPTFAEASRGRTTGLREQPRDVTLSLDWALGAASPVRGSVDSDRVGYFGTSWGGVTGLLLWHDDYDDPRIDAFVVRMGSAPTYITGNWRWDLGAPLLMVHGDGDRVVRYDDARRSYDSVQSRKAFITLHGVGHDMTGDPGVLSQEASVAWFDRYLGNDPSGLDRLHEAIARRGSAATLDEAG